MWIKINLWWIIILVFVIANFLIGVWMKAACKYPSPNINKDSDEYIKTEAKKLQDSIRSLVKEDHHD